MKNSPTTYFPSTKVCVKKRYAMTEMDRIFSGICAHTWIVTHVIAAPPMAQAPVYVVAPLAQFHCQKGDLETSKWLPPSGLEQ